MYIRQQRQALEVRHIRGGRVICLLTFQSDILNTLFSGSSVRCPEIHRSTPVEEVEYVQDEELMSTFNTFH